MVSMPGGGYLDDFLNSLDGGMTNKESRRQARRDKREKALKQAAIDVFYEHGYHAAKVSQIVEEVGVAQGTFYLYFEGKQQLFAELVSDFLELFVSTVADWEPADIDTRQVLREELTRAGLSVTRVLLDNRKMTAIFFREAEAVSPELSTLIRHSYETLLALLTDFNRILCKRGLIAEMNFRILATMTVGMVERVIVERIVHDTIADADPEELVEHLVLHYIAGTTDEVDTAST